MKTKENGQEMKTSLKKKSKGQEEKIKEHKRKGW